MFWTLESFKKLLQLSTYRCNLFLFSMFWSLNCNMNGQHHNIFPWISRFTTIMSQCKGGPWYQVWSKIAGTEIFLISENCFQFYQKQQPEVLYKKGVLKNFALFPGTSGWLDSFYHSCWLYTLQLYIAGNFQVSNSDK